jgi:hypothetical protein
VLFRRDPLACIFPEAARYVELNDFRHKSSLVRASNGKDFQIVVIRFSSPSLPIATAAFETFHSSELLQISSVCFRLALWTFPEIWSKIAFTCGICTHLLRKESGEPGKGVGKRGSIPISQIPKEGLGTSFHCNSETRHSKKPRKPASSIPKHTQTLFRQPTRLTECRSRFSLVQNRHSHPAYGDAHGPQREGEKELPTLQT